MRQESLRLKSSSKGETGEHVGNGVGLLDKSPQCAASPPKLYRRRWLMLSLFALYSFSNAFQWIHLNIIADVIGNFYNESLPHDVFQRNTAIDWLSMVYMLAYIPLIIPATWLLDKTGLRVCCILGSFLNAAGAWLKCASVSPDRFGLLIFAQTLCAISQLFILAIPPRLAAVWFGPGEVSTATSFGVFGNQLGVAAGFLIPPILVPNSENVEALSTDFSIMFYSTAVVTTIIFFCLIIFFQEKPLQPPSRAQQLAVEAAMNENYLQSLTHLLKNVGFLLLTLAYGINTGSYYAISTVLNAILLHYYPGEGVNAGRIGLTIVLMGVLGSILAGVWLDKTKTYKGTTVAIYLFTLAGTLAFTFTLNLNELWVVFFTAGALGFFMTGYLPVGYEFAAELTFPESEGTSSGLLSASAQIFGIIYTVSMRAMMESISVLSANITICISLLIGGIITIAIKPDYRRQEAGKQVISEFFKRDSVVTVAEDSKESELTNETKLP